MFLISIFKVLERNSAKKRQIFILMISLLIEVKGSITLIVFKYDSLLFLVLLNSISRIVKGWSCPSVIFFFFFVRIPLIINDLKPKSFVYAFRIILVSE